MIMSWGAKTLLVLTNHALKTVSELPNYVWKINYPLLIPSDVQISSEIVWEGAVCDIWISLAITEHVPDNYQMVNSWC